MHPDAPTPRLPDSELTDAELLAALKAGQVSALGTVYDRYARLVYGLSLRILANPEEAEDLTQEVFLILWRQNTYNPARGSLSSFLTTLTRSRAIDRLRARGTRVRFLQKWGGMVRSDTIAATPLEQASTTERSQRIRAALEQLPEAERRVLEIAYYEGLSQSEIAQRLDTPLGTVKTRSRQGLLKLRQTLRDFIE
jgi:RNA polymerase sigma-70 factor (ECF subfamily)